MARTHVILAVLIIINITGLTDCMLIDGCPLYGCRPSGTFSFYSDVPKTNASIRWETQFIWDPVPDAMGCSSDSVSIVCQSNGPFSDNKGYVSLTHENGTVRWRDGGVLYFPTLPIIDNYGDVTGSDGVNLVHFDADGKNYPIIPCQDMKPIFSMQLVGQMYLLMVSQLGGLSVRDTQAIPVAEIFLNDTLQRVNGTFLPISTPVVNGNRFYLLTEFVPSTDKNVPASILNMQRLYAIDIHHRMANIMTVAWFFNFEMEDKYKKADDTLRYRPRHNQVDDTIPNVLADTVAFKKNFKLKQESVTGKQILLWDDANSIVNVILPAPYASNRPTTFWGLRDGGNDTLLAFRTDLDVTHMAKFEANDAAYDARDTKLGRESGVLFGFNQGGFNGQHQLPSKSKANPDDVTDRKARHPKEDGKDMWVSLSSNKICSIKPDGNTSRCIDLGTLVGADLTITSKMSLVRNTDSDNDILLFGVTVTKPTDKIRAAVHAKYAGNMNNTCYVITIDTLPADGKLMWAVPVPGNLEVRGQITGSAGADYREKDMLVVFANTAGASAKVFTIH